MSQAPEHFTVWAEIPVTDLDKATAFYDAVFDTSLIRETEPNPMAMFPTKGGQGIAGNLYVGKPARAGEGPTVHLLSPGQLEDALARVAPAGGKVVSDPIAIPMGRFAYILDPDGNSIGIFSYSS